jgi:hypothetical protein
MMLGALMLGQRVLGSSYKDSFMNKNIKCIIVGVVSALVAQMTLADEYHSTFDFPRIDVKNKEYQYNVGYWPAPPNTAYVKGVTWSWADRESAQPLKVTLCQSLTEHCIDVSDRPSGSTNEFNQYRAEFPFYFKVKAYRSPFFAIRTLHGQLKVQW